MWSLFSKWVGPFISPYLAVAIIAGFLALIGWHKLAVYSAYNDGREAEKKAAVIAAGKRIKEMEQNNEAFRKLPAHDRCVAFMRDSGLSIDNCGKR